MQDKMTTRINLRSGISWRTPAILAGMSLSLAALPLSALAAPSSKTDAPLSQALAAQTLAAQAPTGWVSVILKTTAPLTAAQEAQIEALGGDIVRRLPIIQSVTVRIPQRSLAKLTALPFAAHLSLDGLVRKTDAFTTGSSEANLATVTFAGKKGKGTQTYQLTGAGVTVAVLDSGITPAADLSSQSGDFYGQAPSRLLSSVNFSGVLSAPASSSPGPISGVVGTLVGPASNLISGDDGPGGKNAPPAASGSNACDPCGHGTHIAGIIAGNGSRSPAPYCTQTFMGIAPQANLVSVRVLDQNGCSDVSTVIAGLQWIVANQKQYGIRIVNMSLGHPVGESYTTDPICQAVEAVYQAGIVVVCAAGNEGRANGGVYTAGLDNEGWGTGYGSIQSPGNDPYVITVGATKSVDGIRADDKIATYSSRGPSRLDLVMKPDIIAPGNKVISLDAHGSTLDIYAGGTNDIPYSYYVQPSVLSSLVLSGSSADYFQLSGTSMAAPVVAGAAALLLQANPSLSPDTIKARLMLSADKWFAADGTADPLTYGAGYLNIPAALASTAVAQGPAASPALSMNPATGSITVVMDHAIWGSTLWGTGIVDLHALWGSHAIWGSGSIDSSHAIWGSNTVLAATQAAPGGSALSGSHAIWGSSVWGDHALWGSATTAVDLTSTAISGE